MFIINLTYCSVKFFSLFLIADLVSLSCSSGLKDFKTLVQPSHFRIFSTRVSQNDQINNVMHAVVRNVYFFSFLSILFYFSQFF